MGWGTLPARMRSSLRGQYGQRVHPDAVVHHRVSGQITVLKLPIRILFVRHGSDQVVARSPGNPGRAMHRIITAYSSPEPG